MPLIHPADVFGQINGTNGTPHPARARQPIKIRHFLIGHVLYQRPQRAFV